MWGIDCLACQDKFFVNSSLDVIGNDEHALDIALYFPWRGLLLRLKVITVNRALVTSDNTGQEGCIVGGDLTNLLADIDTLLISC
jgi:hypothetical protein